MRPAIRIALTAAPALLLTACFEREPQLYTWGSFPRQQYEALARNGASQAKQISEMEAHAAKTAGRNEALPPGFRAHLGLLHLGMDDHARARTAWLAEKEAFPESAPFMDTLLKKLDVAGAPAPASQPHAIEAAP